MSMPPPDLPPWHHKRRNTSGHRQEYTHEFDSASAADRVMRGCPFCDHMIESSVGADGRAFSEMCQKLHVEHGADAHLVSHILDYPLGVQRAGGHQCSVRCLRCKNQFVQTWDRERPAVDGEATAMLIAFTRTVPCEPPIT